MKRFTAQTPPDSERSLCVGHVIIVNTDPTKHCVPCGDVLSVRIRNLYRFQNQHYDGENVQEGKTRQVSTKGVFKVTH